MHIAKADSGRNGKPKATEVPLTIMMRQTLRRTWQNTEEGWSRLWLHVQGAGKWHGSLGKLVSGPLVRYKITRGYSNVATKSKTLEIIAIVNAHSANPDNKNNKTHKLHKYPVIDLWEMKGATCATEQLTSETGGDAMTRVPM